jgi:starvation-inducible DNA-binding protein
MERSPYIYLDEGGSMNIGLNDSQRKPVVDILNRLLADEVLLYLKTRNFHWNVVGPQFSELHKFFEAQYDGWTRSWTGRRRARALTTVQPADGGILKHARLKESAAASTQHDRRAAGDTRR